ncbi:transposase [Limnofasciculus baicalensis]|uniref:transposase n=1 Tax=Limnofasciculus baicalensis TaxID=3064906 RepID=UPI00359FCDD7
MVNKPRQRQGRLRTYDRRIFDALIYLARTGTQWCALPREFGPKSTVYSRFKEWVEYGWKAKSTGQFCYLSMKKLWGLIGSGK